MLAITVLIATIDQSILNVAIPSLQRELGASASQLQWMVNSYILVFGGLLLTMGSLGDRFGRVLLLRGGLFVFGLASLGAALVDSAWQLIAVRAFMGIGAAMVVPATLSILVDVFHGQERTKAIAIWAALAAVGIVLGPIFGGLLLEHFYWGSVFLINVPVAIVAIIASIFFVFESRDPEAKPLDIPGAFIAQISSAFGMHLFALLGIPVSTSSAIVGAVVGVGLVKGMKAIRKKTIVTILLGWLLTPTLAAGSAFLLYKFIKMVFA